MTNLQQQRGFTLVELVMTIIIIGIMAAVVIPRVFDNNVFQARGFADQVKATLRYAQKVAIAQHRYVCVGISGNSTVTLTQGATTACTGALADQTPLQTPSGISVSNATFNFDSIGKPSAAQSITVTGNAAITVEAETGYVH
jgi:MSHA pilin protein MshC